MHARFHGACRAPYDHGNFRQGEVLEKIQDQNLPVRFRKPPQRARQFRRGVFEIQCAGPLVQNRDLPRGQFIVIYEPFIVAVIMALLTIPANSQMSGGKGMSPTGEPSGRSPPPPDKEKQKKDEKAFNDAVSRIPLPDKKYDPWGTVRTGGNR